MIGIRFPKIQMGWNE